MEMHCLSIYFSISYLINFFKVPKCGRMNFMIKSMTGFGRASYDGTDRSFTIEIKSVNHKFLDISIKTPKNLFSLESRIRKIIQEKISRGKIDILITQNNFKKNDVTAVFNENLCDSYVESLKSMKSRYKMPDNITLSLLLKLPDIITIDEKEEDVESLWKEIEKPLEEALDMLVNMRETEGTKLQSNVVQKCESIRNAVDIIEKREPIIIEDYRKKLTEKVAEVLKDSSVDENRIAEEVALFIDKSSIDEEIVRLKSHISQMKDTLKTDEPIGRKLDFLVQEMNRESNTIASKTNDIETTKLVLNIKNDIEKIREQIQNVE